MISRLAIILRRPERWICPQDHRRRTESQLARNALYRQQQATAAEPFPAAAVASAAAVVAAGGDCVADVVAAGQLRASAAVRVNKTLMLLLSQLRAGGHGGLLPSSSCHPAGSSSSSPLYGLMFTTPPRKRQHVWQRTGLARQPRCEHPYCVGREACVESDVIARRHARLARNALKYPTVREKGMNNTSFLSSRVKRRC